MIKMTVVGQNAKQRGHMTMPDLQDAETLSAFLTLYSKAGLSKVQEHAAEIPFTEIVAETTANLDKKVYFYAIDQVTGDEVTFCIPAPDMSAIATELTSEGERVTQAAGTTICGAWKTAAGYPNALTFILGVVLQRV